MKGISVKEDREDKAERKGIEGVEIKTSDFNLGLKDGKLQIFRSGLNAFQLSRIKNFGNADLNFIDYRINPFSIPW